MIYEDMKPGHIVTAKQYNEMAYAKFKRDFDKAVSQGRLPTEMPQVAFYGFYKPHTGEPQNTGFVCKTERGSHWFKLKREAIAFKVKNNLVV